MQLRLIDTSISPPGARTVHPCSMLVLGFQYQGRLERANGKAWENLAPAGITGLQSVSRTFRQMGPTGTVLAYVPPEEFLGSDLPASELTERSVSLEFLFASGRLKQLHEQLEGAHSAAERISLVGDLLAERQPRRSSAVVRLAANLIRTRGRVSGKELSRLTGLGTRQLQRLFLTHIGISPMEFARLVRFERSIERIRSVGVSAGAEEYADQAHMSHDIKQRTGLTPGQLRSQI
ncbi:MAG: AraC family transcriptional regulator [Leptospirales bacterium]|nr:AraC family transcriptional regulator [Leptospirales bacterium]